MSQAARDSLDLFPGIPTDVPFWTATVFIPILLILVDAMRHKSLLQVAGTGSNLALANVGVAMTGLVDTSFFRLPHIAQVQLSVALIVLALLSLAVYLWSVSVQECVSEVIFWRRVVALATQRRYILRLEPVRPHPVLPSAAISGVLVSVLCVVGTTIAVYAAAFHHAVQVGR